MGRVPGFRSCPALMFRAGTGQFCFEMQEALAGRLVRRDAIPRPSKQRPGRMLNPKHETKAGKIEAALRALGMEAVVHVGDAA